MMVLSKAWRSGVAIISCGLALAVALPLDFPSSCFILAVIVSSLYGGKGPGVLSVLLSSVAFDYFFLPTKHHLWIEPSSYPRFVAFLVPVLLITVVIEAKRRVEEARREIDAKYGQVSADALAQAQKSEARLRLIIDSIPVPAWSSRADGATCSRRRATTRAWSFTKRRLRDRFVWANCQLPFRHFRVWETLTVR